MADSRRRSVDTTGRPARSTRSSRPSPAGPAGRRDHTGRPLVAARPLLQLDERGVRERRQLDAGHSDRAASVDVGGSRCTGASTPGASSPTGPSLPGLNRATSTALSPTDLPDGRHRRRGCPRSSATTDSSATRRPDSTQPTSAGSPLTDRRPWTTASHSCCTLARGRGPDFLLQPAGGPDGHHGQRRRRVAARLVIETRTPPARSRRTSAAPVG